ncbi:hypothetical protein T492DRAFT_836251 [Pavlovales sp. CCMP2436]|nr:hypothetical protein T492DRAFT_836251 [Pavlovales sp. CCMP2436]
MPHEAGEHRAWIGTCFASCKDLNGLAHDDPERSWKSLIAYFAAMEFTTAKKAHMQFYVVFKNVKTSIILCGQAKKGTLRPGFTVMVPRAPNVLSCIGYVLKRERRKRDDKDPDDDDLYTDTYIKTPCPNFREDGVRPTDHGGARAKTVISKFKKSKTPPKKVRIEADYVAAYKLFDEEECERCLDSAKRQHPTMGPRVSYSRKRTTAIHVSLYSATVAARTVPGYKTNPTSSNRQGVWFPLIAVAAQFPSVGIGRDQYIGKEFIAKSMHFTVVFDFPQFGAGYLPWTIELVKMAPRQPVFLAPAQFSLIAAYPYSQTSNGAGDVKMTETIIGKMDSDVGRVVWRKRVPCFKDTSAQGRADGDILTTFSQVLTGSSAVGQPNAMQSGRRTMMKFSIPINKKIYDQDGIADINDAFPKYRLFIYQSSCVGYFQNNEGGTTPTLVVDDIVSHLTFVDP